MKETWKGRPVLTVEDMANMDCPLPPEPLWAERFDCCHIWSDNSSQGIKMPHCVLCGFVPGKTD